MRLLKKLFTAFLLLSILSIGCKSVFARDEGFDEEEEEGGGGGGGYPQSGGGDYDDPYGDGGEGGYDGGYGDNPSPPSIKELTSLEEIDAFLKEVDNEPTVLGFFDVATNSEDLDSFKEVATRESHTHRFAFITQKEILETKKYDGCAVLVYLAPKYVNDKMERVKHRYPSKSLTKTNVLTDFIKLKSLPLAGELTIKSKTVYQELKKPVVTIFSVVDHVRNAKGFSYLANRARKLAKKHENKVYFNIANTDEYKNDMQNDYGFWESGGDEDGDEKDAATATKQTLVGLRDGDWFYTMSSKFSFDNLATFVDDFLAGKLEGTGRERTNDAHGDSSDNGDISDMTPVVATNADNFKEVVEEAKGDVMIEFYAPWCGHCKALKPEYKKVAESFESDDSVTIAAFDATASTIPAQFKVEGYPMLFFIPAKDKKPVPYEGARESQAIVDYIKSHRTAGNEEL